MLFDNRISEISAFQPIMLFSSWDCNMPKNVNDFDLRFDLTEAPQDVKGYTESVFAVVRSRVANSMRESELYNKRVSPALSSIAALPEGAPDGNPDSLYAKIWEAYLRYCNETDPIQYMTVWHTRGMVAKYALARYNAEFSKPGAEPTVQQRDQALNSAMEMLEADSRLMTSDLTAGFRWFTRFHFPMPAYIRISRELQRRPDAARSRRCWMRMNENYQARFQSEDQQDDDGPLFRMFSKFVLAAWEARQAWFLTHGGPDGEEPWMIVDIRLRLAQAAQDAHDAGAGDGDALAGLDELGLPDLRDASAAALRRMADVQGWESADVQVWESADTRSGETLDPRVVWMLEWNTMHGR
jgi:hypothetical protein